MGLSIATLRAHLGYSPIGYLSGQTLPASGVARTNTTKSDCTVCIGGGTVTAVSIGGQATGLVTGSFRVPVGQTITVTYSAAPTYVWFGD